MAMPAVMGVCDSRRAGRREWGCGRRDTWWTQHREASLSWLALGMLLAAWNAADRETQRVQRPQTLKRYAYVSMRAATLICEQRRAALPR